MLTGNMQFEYELKKRIQEEIVRVNEILIGVNGANTVEQYKLLVGQIFAYQRVIENFCDEVNTLINKRD